MKTNEKIMTTKEKITSEALNLFAQKGYKGTSVKDIADAVGIKDSSLYKHFKSKQEILDTIMAEIEAHIAEKTSGMGIPAGSNIEKAVSYYAELDENGLVELSKNIFLFYMNDELMSKFWRMGNMEQFQNNRVCEAFRKFFLEDSIAYQSVLFGEMSKKGIFIKANPEVMAMYFYTPIFFLFSKYAGRQQEFSFEAGSEDENKAGNTADAENDHNTGEDDALGILERQVREFYRIYHSK